MRCHTLCDPLLSTPTTFSMYDHPNRHFLQQNHPPPGSEFAVAHGDDAETDRKCVRERGSEREEGGERGQGELDRPIQSLIHAHTHSTLGLPPHTIPPVRRRSTRPIDLIRGQQGGSGGNLPRLLPRLQYTGLRQDTTEILSREAWGRSRPPHQNVTSIMGTLFKLPAWC